MKFVIILVPGIICFVLGKLKSKYRIHLAALFALYVICMNVFYNARIVPSLMTFRRPVNQLIYQEAYADTLEFPDAFLQLVVDGKTVYTKNDPYTIEEAVDRGFDWLYAYYHMINPTEYLTHYGADVVADEKINNAVINQDNMSDFSDIGYANDMMRNVCMYHPDNTEPANYFTHYWYYGEHIDGMHIYVNFDGLYDTDELVFIWQNADKDNEREDFYVMTKDYYDRNIANNK